MRTATPKPSPPASKGSSATTPAPAVEKKKSGTAAKKEETAVEKSPSSPPENVEDKQSDAAPQPRSSAPEEGSGQDLDRLARQINVQVQRQSSSLKRCYQQSAKVMTPGTPLSGRIEVRFTVQPDGTTRDVKAERNTSDSGQLAQCVVGLVRGWSFPAGLAEPADFLWPFEFEAP